MPGIGISPLLIRRPYDSSPPLPPFPMRGLVAGYHLDGNANDYVGSNHGSGTATYDNYFGIKNQGFTNSTLTIPNSSTFHFTTDMSVSLWMNMDVTQSNGILIAKPEAAGGNGFFINARSASNQLQISTVGLTPDTHTISSVGIYDNSWHNIVITVGLNILTVYVDGSSVYFSPVTGSLVVTTEDLNFGSFQTLFTFGGFLDEINFWNTALTTQEVSDLFGSYGPIKYIESYGDSIMEGSGATHYWKGWMYLVADALGYKLHNHGVSGTTMTNATPIDVGGTPNMWENKSAIPAYDSSKALLVFNYMMNDWGMNFPNYTSSLYQSQYEDVFDEAISKGWPASNIKVVAGFYYNPATAPGFYVTNYSVPTPPDSTRHLDYRSAVSSACLSRGIQYIDLFDTMSNAGGDLILADAVHPNDTGHQVGSDYVVSNL